MRYIQLIGDKLDQADNISRNMEFTARNGNIPEYTKYSTLLSEKIDEIRTLINTQRGQFE